MRTVGRILLLVAAAAAGACGTDRESGADGKMDADTSATAPADLPGEPSDLGPREGDELMVVGVPFDERVDLRAAPGSNRELAAAIEPDDRDLIARGETRHLPDAFWTKVDHRGTVGWVRVQSVAYEGPTHDRTAGVIRDLGERPTADSMAELGRRVAETLAGGEPGAEIVKTVRESLGDLGEVTYDVIGVGDDSVRGYRVHVFAHPGDGGFVLKAVEVTTLCGRGVTGDGLCI